MTYDLYCVPVFILYVSNSSKLSYTSLTAQNYLIGSHVNRQTYQSYQVQRSKATAEVSFVYLTNKVKKRHKITHTY